MSAAWRRETAPRTVPVVVVGAGPVGQTAALLLARHGIPVVVVDARAERDAVGSKSIVQQRDVIDVWDAVGGESSVGRRVAAEGVTWRTARTYHRNRELFAVDFADQGRSPFPPFVNLSQARTEELLDAAITAEPRIEVRWDHRLVTLAHDVDRVTLTFRTASGQATRLSARYVLLCAGAKCDDLRAMLGLSFDGETFDDQFLICDIRTQLPGWQTERRFYFDPAWNPGRQVLVHPCPGGTFRIDWQVSPDFDVAAAEHSGALDRRIRQIVGDREYTVVWRSAYRFHSRIVPRMRVGRVLLAGDCAHLVAPFGARGLNSGVLDAENAAWKLAYVLHGWAPGSLLESYHEERHAAALENLDVTSTTMRFLVPQTDADRKHRLDVLSRAGDDPAAAALVDSGRLAEPYWYHRSPLTTPNPSRPFTGRPPRGQVHPPAPGVLAPDCPVNPAPGAGRFRELARRGVTVLAGGRTVPAVPDLAAPVAVHRADDLDPDGTLIETLGLRPHEVWVVRPDAHIAAILTDPTPHSVATAVRRCLGTGPATAPAKP
jgi:pentachlorophenol monooxygenase/3-(3-hydroxy-phenyl)propionate hydroxylase